MTLLAMDGIVHSYHKDESRNIIHDVSLSLGENDIMALVGESGCGKTTLGKIAAGLVKPTRGKVVYAGNDIATLKGQTLQTYRRGVQLVHQDPYASLNPTLTIYETLSSGMIHHKIVTRRDSKDRVKDLLKIVGLEPSDEFLARFPHQLSGGQRQRVGIARSLAIDPKIIVADESVSMLDVSMRVSILDLMLRLKEEKGLSYLFITHDFGVVRYFAEGYRIGVLYFGTLVEEGLCTDVIEHPQHPYTYSLLSAVPIADPRWNRSRPRVSLKNVDVDTFSNDACKFVHRCPFADHRCANESPRLRTVLPNHKTACFYPERIPSGTGGNPT